MPNLANPTVFVDLTRRTSPWLAAATAALFAVGFGDLEQGMQFVADDLDVRALLLQHGKRLLAHRLPKGTTS